MSGSHPVDDVFNELNESEGEERKSYHAKRPKQSSGSKGMNSEVKIKR